VISLFIPATTDLVAAVSAGWLVLGRTLLTVMEQRSTLAAVRVQELYDTELFHLPWNAALAGRRPSPDDIAAAARHITDDADYRKWHGIDLGSTTWPGNVLLCQRQSMAWSRRDHRAYASTILIAGTAWFLVGVIIALVRDLSLADYLIKIFLPSAPAFVDSVDLARAPPAREQPRTGRRGGVGTRSPGSRGRQRPRGFRAGCGVLPKGSL
jgi:predicted pore-forming effector associated with SMODS systems